ncbi:MAG TPA: alpha/beta hydrolase-fold protein [Gemmatimonadales bacterium]|nr:alpha/beta hydrolase-fold protein [Gemmatimonadales bacterium]
MSQWQDLPLPPERQGEGSPALVAWRKLRSPELHNYRDVLVALPPSYHGSGRHYPVVYMHDGQNLFDPATSYAGDWSLPATLAGLAREGIETIVVGIANKGSFRRYEYSPFRDEEHGGGDGDRYLAFITETVQPLVNRDFRTLQGPGHTAMAGSSMGGLISVYALYRRPDLFGSAAALSPSAWFAGEALVRMAASEPAPPGRLYLDVGTGESAALLDSVRRLRETLLAAGLAEGPRFRYVEDEGADHHESHWGRRFGEALPFLLGRRVAESAGRNDSTAPSDMPTGRLSDSEMPA